MVLELLGRPERDLEEAGVLALMVESVPRHLQRGVPLFLRGAEAGALEGLRGGEDARGSRARLEVDGGITRTTIRTAWEAGADTFVAGTAVFGARDPAQAVRDLKTECTSEA